MLMVAHADACVCWGLGAHVCVSKRQWQRQTYLYVCLEMQNIPSCTSDGVCIMFHAQTLEPIFAMFKAQRRPGESFGDFVARVGFEAVREFSTAYVPAEAAEGMPQVAVAAEVLQALEQQASDKGMSAAHLVNDVLQQYLSNGGGNGTKRA